MKAYAVTDVLQVHYIFQVPINLLFMLFIASYSCRRVDTSSKAGNICGGKLLRTLLHHPRPCSIPFPQNCGNYVISVTEIIFSVRLKCFIIKNKVIITVTRIVKRGTILIRVKMPPCGEAWWKCLPWRCSGRDQMWWALDVRKRCRDTQLAYLACINNLPACTLIPEQGSLRCLSASLAVVWSRMTNQVTWGWRPTWLYATYFV